MGYENNVECRWIVKAPLGKRITLHFNAFKTEHCHDGLSIYDGETVRWWKPEELQQELCGDIVPADVESNNNTILIRWTSDETVSDMGFELKYSIK